MKTLIKKNRIPVKQMLLIGFLPSVLKKMYYKSKGYKFGENVSIGLGSVIVGKNVEIQSNTSIGMMTVVRAKSIKIDRFVKIGHFVFIDTEQVEIGEDTRINEQVVIAGIKNPDSIIKIGKRVIVMEYSYLNPTKPLTIGDDTGIGGHCLLFTHGSWLSQIDGFPVTFAPITLGNKVWLPWRVFIMPGVTVGDNVVIGANSLVSKNLPANSLAAGSPAKVLVENYPPQLTEEKRTEILKNIFTDFINFISYNGFSVSGFDESMNKFVMDLKNNETSSSLIYVPDKNYYSDTVASDNVLLMDSPDADTKLAAGKFKMVINLRTKERIGTSAIGEEITMFLSRYGIRCNRLD